MRFETGVAAFGLIVAATAGPIVTGPVPDVLPRQTKARTQVSQSLYDTLIFYGRYCATYPEAPCQMPPQGTVVQGFANADPTTEMTLFRDDARRELIMAFPGTAGVEDLFTDVSATQVPATIAGVNCPACRVHQGVLKSWNAIQPEAQRVLDQAIAAYPSHKVIVAGHSLGGALTKFAYASLKSQGYNISAAYSYGEFRTGNQAWADFVDKLSGNTDSNQGPYYRVTHADDGVPQVLGPLQGYRHSRSEYWFRKGADGPTTTFRCYGQEPSDCNNSQLAIGVFGINLAHIFYPGINVTGCGGFTPTFPSS
ncbi:Putative fungal lipase-like domain, alpha/Beta hydrolase [Septoria linicola]|uniref:Fungal lipase-like domain, alpha/Beta hydrolase n=1 Tax=Septoria linicola TaxID=215465 RepID=A0A9Q9AH99_9PEZI|nr:putative fungal lipase-like domain, alpha/Beta hydrolase [Septoria linicola]USW49162.1 Putative fungal lipase-like domain, alpha/Beta hydrolase [Septoria linicola]